MMKLVRVRRKDGTKYLALLVEPNPRQTVRKALPYGLVVRRGHVAIGPAEFARAYWNLSNLGDRQEMASTRVAYARGGASWHSKEVARMDFERLPGWFKKLVLKYAYIALKEWKENPRHLKNPIVLRREAAGHLDRARSQIEMAAEALSPARMVVATGDPESMEMAGLLQYMRRLERSVDAAARMLRRR